MMERRTDVHDHNNKSSVLASLTGLGELFKEDYVDTIAYPAIREGDILPSVAGASVRVFGYGHKHNSYKVLIFVKGPEGATLECERPLNARRIWEPYDAWILGPETKHLVLNRVSRLGVKVHWTIHPALVNRPAYIEYLNPLGLFNHPNVWGIRL